jgi:hypothetical protein
LNYHRFLAWALTFSMMFRLSENGGAAAVGRPE